MLVKILVLKKKINAAEYLKKGEIVPLKSEISDDKNFCVSYDACQISVNID